MYIIVNSAQIEGGEVQGDRTPQLPLKKLASLY